MNTNPQYFLVTGAGAGLGRAFCKQLAEKGYGILAVSLHEHELADLRKELPPDSFHALALDLSDSFCVEGIQKWLDTLKISPVGLINNAGMGYSKPFESLSAQFVKTLTALNVDAVANISHALLPLLRLHPRAYILNISSMAAFFPMPYKSAYAATKAFVLRFSLALNQELKGSGITVSCACPGPMNTSEEVKQRIAAAGWKKGMVGALDPDDVARKCLQAMFNGQARIILRWQDRLLLAIASLFPAAIIPAIMNRLYRKSF